MWKCPKCARTFDRTNQDHYCTEFNAIDEYIEAQPDDVQPELRELRATIRAAAPDALEKISWRMPTFWQGTNLIHFAAFKKHIGLYPGPEAIEAFADRLASYRTTKGAIQLPLSRPLDRALVTDIVRWRLAHLS